MKKLACISLVAISLMGLAACGGSKEDDSNKRVLKVEFVEAGFGLTPYEELAKAFMAEHPDVKVKLVPNRNMADTTATRISNGTASDIMIYNRDVNNIRLWSLQNLIYDLSEVFEQECENGEKVIDRLDDTAKKVSAYKGKYLVVPEYYNINGFVYNSDLFENMGWSVPTTTKEFEELCNTINSATLPGDHKCKPLVYCRDADGYLYYADQGWTTCYEGVANLDEFYKFSSPEVYAPDNSVGKLHGLKKLKQYFFDSGYQVDGSNTMGSIQAQSKLLTFDAAMMLNGSWFENEMKPYVTEKSPKFKMFAVPELSDDEGNVLHSTTYTCPTGKSGVVNCEFTANMFIPAKAKNIPDAIDWIKFTSKASSCEIWTKYSNSVRPLKYNYSSTNPAYANMSGFGKSVLDIADSKYLYVPTSSSDIAVIGHAGFRPNGYWFWNFKDNTPEMCVEKDYNLAKDRWSLWQREAEETFGNN